MSDTKESFYGDLTEALYGVIPTEQIQKVMDVVSTQLSQYDLTVKPHEVVVYDGGDADMIKRFFIAKATEGLTERSLDTYKRALSNAIRQMGKHIKDITTDDVRIMLANMRINGKSEAYQNLFRRALSSFFKFLAGEGLIQKNPMARIPSIREPKKVRMPFSEEELELLRANAGSLRDQCIIEFLYSTGCRISEMEALNREDINFEKNEVMVLGKGRKYRMVYFSPRCKILLERYLKSREDSCEALFVTEYNRFYAPLGKEITRLGIEGIETMLRVLGRRTGVKNVHAHRFRRTAATLALKRGMKLTDVQRMLGHTDIKTTTIYATTTDDEVKREHQKYLI